MTELDINFVVYIESDNEGNELRELFSSKKWFVNYRAHLCAISPVSSVSSLSDSVSNFAAKYENFSKVKEARLELQVKKLSGVVFRVENRLLHLLAKLNGDISVL